MGDSRTWRKSLASIVYSGGCRWLGESSPPRPDNFFLDFMDFLKKKFANFGKGTPRVSALNLNLSLVHIVYYGPVPKNVYSWPISQENTDKQLSYTLSWKRLLLPGSDACWTTWVLSSTTPIHCCYWSDYHIISHEKSDYYVTVWIQWERLKSHLIDSAINSSVHTALIETSFSTVFKNDVNFLFVVSC